MDHFRPFQTSLLLQFNQVLLIEVHMSFLHLLECQTRNTFQPLILVHLDEILPLHLL